MGLPRPYAAEILTAERLQSLGVSSREGQYVPQLTATTTNPDLSGSSSVQYGWFQRNGRLIRGMAIFRFGSGSSPGSGNYEITLPYDVDTNFQRIDTTYGDSSPIGVASLRQISPTSPATGRIMSYVHVRRNPNLASVLRNPEGTNLSVNQDNPNTWEDFDYLKIWFRYVADIDDLPDDAGW